MRSDVGVAVRFSRTTGMRHRTLLGITHKLRIFPESTRLEVMLTRRPALTALGQLVIRQLDCDGAGFGVDRDDVAVLQQADRAANGRFRTDMADAEATGSAGE